MPDSRPISHPLRIAVIGTGYVGLVSAACLAHIGHHVTAVDSDAGKVHALQRGAIPIYEAGLQPLVAAQAREGRLLFSHATVDAVHGADLVFIAVGTPTDAQGGADLRALRRAVEEIAACIVHPLTVVIKSTVPVGTSDAARAALRGALARRGIDWEVPVLSNPEFLREGTATEDFLNPARILVGARTAHEAAVLGLAYEPLVRQGVPLIVMSPRSAELSKYAANTMLAARISFINEIADIAQATGADIEEVREGLGTDPRIGPAFLKAGIGYGGSCFPKDVSSLRNAARSLGVPTDLLAAVERVNERHRHWPVARLAQAYGGRKALRGLRVAVWGLAFKPGTDDLREAASLVVLQELVEAGAAVAAYDPVAMRNAVDLVPAHPLLEWRASAADALEGAHALLLLTEWREFIDFPPERVAEQLKDALVIDGRNALSAPRWEAAGLQVHQVGRPVGDTHPSLPVMPWRDAGDPRARPAAAAGTS